MPEVRYLRSVHQTPNQPGDRFIVKSRKPLPHTGEPKFRVKGRIGDQRVKLIESVKSYDSEIAPVWHDMKSLGIPVVPEMRIEGFNTYTTDLTADGSHFYGKSKLRELSGNGKVRRRKTDDFFISLTESSALEKIMRRGIEIADIASKNGIDIAVDDPFDLLISPDGSYDIYCLDLTGVRKHTIDGYSHERLQKHNHDKVRAFIKLLTSIRELLLKKQQTLWYKIQRIFIP